MERTDAINVLQTIQFQRTYFTDMGITTQLTELTKIGKLLEELRTTGGSEGISPIKENAISLEQLEEIHTRRKLKLQLSLQALYVLEKEWDVQHELLRTLLDN